MKRARGGDCFCARESEPGAFGTRLRIRVRSFIGAVVLGVGLCGPAAAQSVTLRVADSFPAGHYVARYATSYWMEQTKKLAGGDIGFEYYPAEQLGKAKDMLSLVQTGVADIGYIAPSYISDKLPLSAVAELPWTFSGACVGTAAFWRLARPGGALDVREFKPLGVRLLFALMLPPNQLVLSRSEFGGLASLQGLKLRTSGAAKEILLRRLKAIPIQIAAPEIHEAMSRGTIDGMLIPLSSLGSYDLVRLSRVATFEENFGSFLITYGISENRWKSLSPKIQDAMVKAGDETTARACQLVDADEAATREKIKAEGVKLIQLSAEDKKVVAALSAEVAREWALGLDQRGKGGTPVLQSFEGALQ